MISSRINTLAGVPARGRPGTQGTAARAISPPAAIAESEINSPLRKIAFGMGLGLLVVRFSMLNQMIQFALHVNLLLLYVFGIPTFFGVALSGGIPRTFRGRPAYYWTAYALWMVAAIPFSSWRTDSLRFVWVYWRTDFPVLFVIAGLTITWRECGMTMRAIAWAGVLSIGAARVFADARYQDRLGLTVGTVANPNDYACVLLLLLPFVLWLCLRPGPVAVRLAMFGVVAYGIYAILRTGSRGAALGLLVEIIFFMYRGSARQRIALLVIGPILMVVAAIKLESRVMERIHSFSQEGGSANTEAAESLELRQYTLRKSFEYTLTHPIFGVGPGQFPSYEGQHNKTIGGRHGYWLEAHNAFLQASSECGIPALLFFLAGLVSTYRLLNATYRKARETPDCEDIRATVFCVMLGLVGFCVGITFLNFAYFFYQPAIGGLAIAISSAAEEERQKRIAGKEQTAPSGVPARTTASQRKIWTAWRPA